MPQAHGAVECKGVFLQALRHDGEPVRALGCVWGGGRGGGSYRTLGVCPSLRINRLFTLLSSLLLLYHAPGSELNGGLNMLCIFERHVLNGERPEYLRRPGKGSSTKSSVTTAPATTVAAAGWWQLGAVLL